MTKLDVQELIQKLAHNIKMLEDHEASYVSKRKGNAYFTNKILIEKRIDNFKHRLKTLGRSTEVIRVDYKVKMKDHKWNACMFFSNVSSEVAILLTQHLQPYAQEITTCSLVLGTEIS